MGSQWVVVVVAVGACLLYSPEARPTDPAAPFPSRSTVRLQQLSSRTRSSLNRVWDSKLQRYRGNSAQKEAVNFFETPGDGKYTFGYSGGRDSGSHLQASNGQGQTVGRYSYVDAEGKDVQVHYVSGKEGFKVISNNLPEETDEVKRARENFFKIFEEKKKLLEETRQQRARSRQRNRNRQTAGSKKDTKPTQTSKPRQLSQAKTNRLHNARTKHQQPQPARKQNQRPNQQLQPARTKHHQLQRGRRQNQSRNQVLETAASHARQPRDQRGVQRGPGAACVLRPK
ncbi:uncharacterized protein LOC123512251 [Portunus trituberculatus]|uniref:uncharacterized protein LOC123512251 n=1 Tax=Portunus trituberculatus TaxID=210409 RepID=UPI001E1CD4F4|nr:uncharacterized protein LOC123512251 [Portunus trituberculatus]